MQRLFSVILVPQPEGGFFVECPGLPGCYSQGETREEAMTNIREAIELTLEDLSALGEAIPEVGVPTVEQVRIAV